MNKFVATPITSERKHYVILSLVLSNLGTSKLYNSSADKILFASSKRYSHGVRATGTSLFFLAIFGFVRDPVEVDPIVNSPSNTPLGSLSSKNFLLAFLSFNVRSKFSISMLCTMISFTTTTTRKAFLT
jgi:hypothetical protein